MGGGISSAELYKDAKKMKKSEEEIVRLLMPVYYTCLIPNADDIRVAGDAWNLILTDSSHTFIEQKRTDELKDLEEVEIDGSGAKVILAPSCIMWFYDIFYKRLFDVHPSCKHMFAGGIKQQGKFLVRMLSLALSELADPSKFDATLVMLAKQHCDRGIKAVEYGVVGEVLFFTLRFVLGSAFTERVHAAWVKIFCRMLKTMVPVAIAYELQVLKINVNSSVSKERKENEQDCGFLCL